MKTTKNCILLSSADSVIVDQKIVFMNGSNNQELSTNVNKYLG